MIKSYNFRILYVLCMKYKLKMNHIFIILFHSYNKYDFNAIVILNKDNVK